MTIKRLILAVFLLLLLAVQVSAQSGPSDATAEEIQKELWCPICQGIRLDVCEQKVCEQMRDLIDEELAAGKNKEEIKAEFVELYGPVILGEPPREGFTLLAWVVPILLLLGGLAAAVVLTRRWSKKSTPAPVASPAAASAPPDEADDYLARVERDLGDS